MSSGNPASAIVGTSGICGGARLRGHRERADLPRLDLGRDRAEVLERGVHLAAEEIGDDRRAALVRDVDAVGVGHLLEQLEGEVVRGSRSARPERDLPGLLSHLVEQLLDRFRRERELRDQHVRRRDRERDRREVADRVVAEVLEERRIDREDADRADQDRVAVRVDFATNSAAMLPFAPGLFSTTAGCPRYSWNFEPIARPTVSEGPPGTNGMTILIGLVGYACACTAPVATRRSAAAPINHAVHWLLLVFDGGKKFMRLDAGRAASRLPRDTRPSTTREENPWK